MKTEDGKCGEIFRRGPGFFIFSCAYCSDYFDSKEDALDHIENHFILQPEPICMDQINPESCELSSIRLNDVQETIEIDENSIQSFSGNIIESLKIEIQDPFLNIFTDDDNIKLESELASEIEEAELSNHCTIFEHKDEKENKAIEKQWILNRKKIIKCDVCGKVMQNASLSQHMKFSHGIFRKSIVKWSSEKEPTLSLETEPTQLDISSDYVEDIDSTREKGYITKKPIINCDKCGKQMQKKHLNRHLKDYCEMSTVKCSPDKEQTLSFKIEPTQSDINYEYNKENNSIRKRGYTTPTLNCDKCGKQMQRKHLNRHIKNYCETSLIEWGPTTTKMLLECDFCGKKLYKRQIRFHLQSHANSKTFICSICRKRFNNEKLLQKHKNIHSDNKKYCCHVCGHQFNQNSNLTVHLRTHTGEKRYQCNLCDKQFAQSYTLTLHMRIHTGEKPYSCEICGLKFRANSTYWSHKKQRHFNKRAYKCDVCGHSFRTKESLREHSRIHTGERPYTCNVCNLSFARYFTCKQHQILHTGTKPYKCRFCDKNFAQSAARRWHERSIHKDPKRENNFKYE